MRDLLFHPYVLEVLLLIIPDIGEILADSVIKCFSLPNFVTEIISDRNTDPLAP
jgi:hypothetical protein